MFYFLQPREALNSSVFFSNKFSKKTQKTFSLLHQIYTLEKLETETSWNLSLNDSIQRWLNVFSVVWLMEV